MNQGRAKYVWDYDLTQEQFDDLLAGRWSRGSLNRDWAAVRLIEYARYEDMIRTIGFLAFLKEWPHWRKRVRSEEQRQEFDWLTAWLPVHHPELLIHSGAEKIADERG